MRLFVAFDLPAEVRQALGELIAQLCPLCPKARWVRSQSMHLTLKFLGHVDDQAEAQLAAIRSALAAVHSPAPVEMQFRGVGFFPDARRPRVVWCGIDCSPNLVPLAKDIDLALKPLGFPPEDRPFVPHLTLARLDAGRGAAQLVRAAEQLTERSFGSARESEFHLFQSILRPSGAEYRKLQSYGFVKGAA
ncbi:MAG: RNA 2',3'-cyclic phosphodiesterase [Acidobacteriia bacterium]|nr:RNA 2',3'-cyclic phosphodiesterase [Terriglobia bacterium]